MQEQAPKLISLKNSSLVFPYFDEKWGQLDYLDILCLLLMQSSFEKKITPFIIILLVFLWFILKSYGLNYTKNNKASP